jgi:predicted nucleic acid-binding protein
MKVLDATFLIDYLDGLPATKAFYETSGGEGERWIIPVPAYAEVLVGVGNRPKGDVDDVRDTLRWAETHPVDEQTAAVAATIANEIGSEGPFLDGIDALVAAVGRVCDAPVVSADTNLTHETTQQVVDVETYR